MDHHDYAKENNALIISGGTEYETICPRCKHEGKKLHIQIVDGLFHCKHCEFQGLWAKEFKVARAMSVEEDLPVATEWDINYVNNCVDLLTNTKSVRQMCLDYLCNQRHLDLKILEQYKIGYDNKYIERLQNSFDCIVIPEIRNGVVTSIDWRLINPPNSQSRYEATPGARQLFNLQSLELNPDCCILTEGRIDALSAIQLSPGIPVIGLPNKELSDKFLPLFSNHQCIWLAIDNTPESQQSAEKIADKLGAHRVYRVIYPAKDVNDLLERPNAKELWVEALKNAKPFKKLLYSFGEYQGEFKEMLDGPKYASRSTGLPHLDQITGYLRPGELTTLSGVTGSGKTTLATKLAVALAQQDIKVLLGSFEDHPLNQYIPSILSHLNTHNIADTPAPGEEGVKLMKEVDKWDKFRFINDDNSGASLEEIVMAIHQAYKEGYRAVILDHLHYFVKSSEKEREDLDNAIRILGDLAKRQYKDLIFVLLCHLKKVPNDYKTGLPQRANFNMLKGTSNIEKESQTIWILNKDPITHLVDLTVEKIRTYKTNVKAGGKIALNFNKRTFQYHTGILSQPQ